MVLSWVWDPWQQRLIDHKGSVTARCGRQDGKSAAAGKRIANQMLEYTNSVSLITAPAERQSFGLFQKVLIYLHEENDRVIAIAGSYVDDPLLSAKSNLQAGRRWFYDHGIFNENITKNTVVLKKDFGKPRSPENAGSVLYAYPAGRTGVFLRFLTLDFLNIDEAAYVPQVVYDTLKPMLAVSEKKRGLGWEMLLSTPDGKGGFFYDSHHSNDFLQFHVSSEDCHRISKGFLAKERRRLTKQQYAQEHLAEFIDAYTQFFPTKLLKERMSFIEWSFKERVPSSSFYLGVDIARYGGDENAFVVVEMVKKRLRVVRCFTTDRVSTVDTIGRIQAIDKKFGFKKIFIDDAGVGGGVTDVLIDRLGRRVVGLNNASKRFVMQGEERKRGILKEDLYSNTLMLLETGLLEMISDLDLLRSLKSITFEYTAEGKVRISGSYSHLSEALIRACWCVKERGLDLYIR